MCLTSKDKRKKKAFSLLCSSFFLIFNRTTVSNTHSVGGLQSPDTAYVCVCVYLIRIPHYAPKARARESYTHKPKVDTQHQHSERSRADPYSDIIKRLKEYIWLKSLPPKKLI